MATSTYGTIDDLLARAEKLCTEKNFSGAQRLIDPYLHVPLLPEQKLRLLRICVLLAQHVGNTQPDGNNQQVAALCDEAIAIAISLDRHAEIAELSAISAEAHHNNQYFITALQRARFGLSAIRSQQSRQADASRFQEITLLDRYVTALFLDARFEDALRHAYFALELTYQLPSSGETLFLSGRLHWTIGLLHRWRGKTAMAWSHIHSALSIYEQYGRPMAVARLHIVAADALLDPLIPMGNGMARSYDRVFIQLATLHIREALRGIDAVPDSSALCMAQLAQLRLSRLLGTSENRIARLEDIGRTASELHDFPLMAQVYTALGDEFGSYGSAEIESQRNCYRRALGVNGNGQASAYNVWPLRGLLRASEFVLVN